MPHFSRNCGISIKNRLRMQGIMFGATNEDFLMFSRLAVSSDFSAPRSPVNHHSAQIP
jgi:hypothetical protein